MQYINKHNKPEEVKVLMIAKVNIDSERGRERLREEGE